MSDDKIDNDLKEPKAFISYSWTSPGHQERVRSWADRLMNDGVKVMLDIYDLKPGQDKYHFMEKMVTDDSVKHVLMMCDKSYKEKADKRKSGVGTESQIISNEVYEKVEQTKFIPIVCEKDEKGEPYLPTFLKSKIWIDFSTHQLVNQNWEELIRVLYGKPQHVKPELGKAPLFVREDSIPSNPVIAKFSYFKQAKMDGKPSIGIYRNEFLDACFLFADSLRIRKKPEDANFGERVLADCGKLKLVRDHIVDWVLLEACIKPYEEFQDNLIRFLERMLEIKARPIGLNAWNDSWFEAHGVFVYETFLYIVSALLKSNAYQILREIFKTYYLQPEGVLDNIAGEMRNFSCFWYHSEALQKLSKEGTKLYSPAAELIKRQADRSDITFDNIMESEALILMMSLLSKTRAYWYPGTLNYSQGKCFPLFMRAQHHKWFEKLSIITGINDAQTLEINVLKGMNDWGYSKHSSFWYINRFLPNILNLENLDKIK